MNYFKDLLESYSRLKKRNLTLLEAKADKARVKKQASDEALAAAKTEAEAAIRSALGQFKVNPQTGKSDVKQFPYKSKNGKLVIFTPSTTENNVNFKLAGTGFNKTSARDKAALVNFLVSDQKTIGQQNAEAAPPQQQKQISPEEQARLDLIKREGHPPGDTIDRKFPGVGKFFKKIQDNIGKVIDDLLPFASKIGSSFMKGKLSKKFLGTFYGGGNKYNLEHGLTTVTVVSKSTKGEGILLEVGSLNEEEAKLQRKMVEAAAERLERGTKLLSKIVTNPGSITAEDISEFNSIFKLRGNCRSFLNGGHSQDCRIMIATGVDGAFEGVIFTDTHGQLKSMLALAMEKTKDFEKSHGFPGVNIEFAKLYTDSKGRAAITHLSKVTEIATILHSHYSNCKTNNMPPEYCKDRAKYLLDKYSEKMEGVSDLVYQYNRILERGEESSTISDKEFEEMLDFMGASPEAKERLRHIIKLTKRLSTESLKNRKPDFIINVGEDVGFGKRADNIELYRSREALIEGLKKEYSDEDIAKFEEEGTIKCGVTAKDAFGGAGSEEYGMAKSHGVVNDSDSFCTLNVSEKNYTSFGKGVTMGSQRTSTIASILTGKVKDILKKDLVETARRAMRNALGFSNKDMQSCADYHNNIENEVNGILQPLFKTKAVVVDGKEKIVWDTKHTAKSVLSQLRQNLSQKDCNSEPYKSILQEANKLENDPKADPQEFLSRIATVAKQKKMNNDLHSNDPEVRLAARKYAASLVFSSGGASDGVMVHANSMLEKKRYTFRQNEAFDYVQQAIAGDGDWEFKVDKSGETMVVNKNNPDEYISLSMERVNSTEGFNTNYSSNMSEAMMKRLSRGNKTEIKDMETPEAMQNMNESKIQTQDLMSFLNENKEVIEKLFQFITKGV